MPSAATRKPGTIRRRAGKRVIRRAPIWVDPMVRQIVIGMKARPLTNGV